eukprot:TRINITY_DN12089_c0_g1_i1.p1 TRINITY_DN12089_c0_g1~~TRINITY_DN12089_c0_g1_i1.p1  ORF type:complete len:614 (+),score=62.20 TRINITY_DN12089_c0_g1_i1:41-1882(+)
MLNMGEVVHSNEIAIEVPGGAKDVQDKPPSRQRPSRWRTRIAGDTVPEGAERLSNMVEVAHSNEIAIEVPGGASDAQDKPPSNMGEVVHSNEIAIEVPGGAKDLQEKPPSTHGRWREHYINNTLPNSWQAFPKMLMSAFIGTIATFRLQHKLQISSVAASSTMGVLANSLPAPYREIVFCGSFAGMSSHIDKGGPFSYGSVCGLGILVGIVFQCSTHFLNGAGGKLGTIAFVSGLVIACISKAFGVDVDLWKAVDPWANWTVTLAIGAVAAAGLACTLTVTLMNKSPPMSSTTLASATTGLAAITLLASLPDGTLSNFEVKILTFFSYTGSFAGMSAANRVGSLARIILAGFGSGVILLGLWPLCPGVGGKFGFSSMLSVLLVERLPVYKFGHTWPAIDSDQSSGETVVKQRRLSRLPRKLSRKVLSDGCPEVSSEARAERLDWLDWVPARCWAVLASFLNDGATKEAAKSAIEGQYGDQKELSQGTLSDILESVSDSVDVTTLLKACHVLEVSMNPPPPLSLHAKTRDATTQFCLSLFQAIRTGLGDKFAELEEDELPRDVVQQLLCALDVPVEALNPVVTAEKFSTRIEKRALSLQKLTRMKTLVDAGAYH